MISACGMPPADFKAYKQRFMDRRRVLRLSPELALGRRWTAGPCRYKNATMDFKHDFFA
jgi:hypothetical protein